MIPIALAPPRALPPEPDPDRFQASAIDAVAAHPDGHVLVVGPPGSGKTTLAVALAQRAIQRGLPPEQVVVLTPSRQAASRLRDRVAAAAGVPARGPLARSIASFAWTILRSEALRRGEPPPVLVTGAIEDDILRVLLSGHRIGSVPGPSWEGVVPPEATALPAFRHELRDLLMRAEEADLGPEDLERLGRETGRPEWIAAAAVFREYEANLGLRRTSADQGELFDSSGLVAAAADVLARANRDVAPVKLVIVDDAQDATRAAVRLFATLAGRGAQAVLIGNADQAVQGYRGAVPHVLAGALVDPPAGLGARVLRLETGHRFETGLSGVSARIAERIGTSREFTVRHPTEGEPSADSVEVIVSPDGGSEARALAARLRSAHRGPEGVPWSEMAVVARTGDRARQVHAALVAEGIPCASLREGRALHRESAVVPLLTLAKTALGEAMTAETAHALLVSRVIGLNPVSVRRLRRLLVEEERAQGGSRAGGELLGDALGNPARLASIRGPEAARAAEVARAVARGRTAAQSQGTAGDVLWAIWESLGVAEPWRRAALQGSVKDDEDLDAVVALFETAARYQERLPEASPASFLSSLEGLGFADDTLADRGRVPDAVAFETPVSAVGREWDIVAIAGLEEGVWPNLRVRDSILGSVALAELVSGRSIGTSSDGTDHRMARAEVLADELRSFYLAFTRARSRVIALCREGPDDRPSRFVSLIDGTEGERRTPAGEIGGISSLADAVARLRREAEALSPSERRGHVEMLVRLVREHVPGADPGTWHGVRPPSVAEPLWGRDAPVRLSPSAVEDLETCPLRSVLVSAGGRRDVAQAAQIGRLVHAIAAEHPTGGVEELLAALEDAWPNLGLSEGWQGDRVRAKVRTMIENLASYIARIQSEGWQVDPERGFRVEAGRAVLVGRVDRLHRKDGTARIVDLKTGSADVTKAEALTHAQLAMYQLAAELGAFPGVEGSAGAELVFLGTDSPAIRTQGPVDGRKEINRVDRVVEVLSQASFEAQVNENCTRTCPVIRSCPAWPQGGKVCGS